MKKGIILISWLLFVYCWMITGCTVNERSRTTDFIIAEKDLIPEGLTVDDSTGIVYVSSTYKRKIVAIDPSGNVHDFIPEAAHDIKSVIGMEADSRRRLLWVVSSEAIEVLPLKAPGNQQWRSSLYCFRLTDGQLVKQHLLNRDSVFLNDLITLPDGRVFATETKNNGIYQLQAGHDTLELWLRPHPYTFLNGICMGRGSGKMYVSCAEGILAIDMGTRRLSLLPVAPDVNAREIDGLSYYQGSLIGHQSTKVSRFYFNPEQDSITHSVSITENQLLDGTTTGESFGDQYYFIVNSQIQSGADIKNRVIKPSDSLEPVIIRKLKLE